MNAEQAAAILAKAELFAGLGEAELSELAGLTVERTYDKGQFIFFQGDPGDSLFVLAEGSVKVAVTSQEGTDMVLATLQPPEVFGELGALDGGARSASVQALSRTRVLKLGRDLLLGLLAREPRVTEAMLRSLGSLVRRLDEQAADLVSLDLHGRLAKLLLRLAAERGGGPTAGAALDLHMTQGDLAAMVGGSRQSINQILHLFERRGFLEVRGRSLILKDIGGLRRRAGLPSLEGSEPRRGGQPS